MEPTITIEIPADREALVRQVLALQDELDQLALTAPEGTVLDACETALLEKGRKLNTDLLAQAVTRRVEVAEKKGRRSAPAPAVGPKKTAGLRPGSS